MNRSNHLIAIMAKSLITPVALIVLLLMTGISQSAGQNRPQGTCDIYAAAGNPCVAAHSTTADR